MSLVSLQEAKALINSHLQDSELQALIDRVEAELVTRFGAAGTSDISEDCYGDDCELFTSRPFSAITSVTDYQQIGSSGTSVSSTEYQAIGKQGYLKKASGSWGIYTTVVYAPIDQDSQRKRVIIDLVKLDLARSPLAMEQVQDEFEYQSPEDWNAEREKIIRSLGFLAI